MYPTLIKSESQVIDQQKINHLLRIELKCIHHGILTLHPGDELYSYYKRRASSPLSPIPCPMGTCDEDMIWVRK